MKDDLVVPSPKGQAKLDTLRPILHYHERADFIEAKVLRVRQATVALLAGAAVIITEPTLELLSAEELQAVVAHELAHEYFWNEIEPARERSPQKLQEIEMRCDGIAIITLVRLGLNPPASSRRSRRSPGTTSGRASLHHLKPGLHSTNAVNSAAR